MSFFEAGTAFGAVRRVAPLEELVGCRFTEDREVLSVKVSTEPGQLQRRTAPKPSAAAMTAVSGGGISPTDASSVTPSAITIRSGR